MLITRPFTRVGDTSMARITRPHFFHDNFVDYNIQITDEYLKSVMTVYKNHYILEHNKDDMGKLHIRLYYKQNAIIRYYATLIFETEDLCLISVHRAQRRRHRR